MFKLFQSGIVLGKNEKWYWFVLAYNCLSFWLWFVLGLLRGMVLASTVWVCVSSYLETWKPGLNVIFSSSSSGGQFTDCNIFVILSLWFLLHGLFNTNLAAWCCIISSLWMDVCWYGSHIAKFSSNSSFGYSSTWGCDNLHLFRPKTDFGKNTLQFKGAQLYNSLPSHIRVLQNLSAFRCVCVAYFS